MTALWAVCHVDKSVTFLRALLDQSVIFQDLVIVHRVQDAPHVGRAAFLGVHPSYSA
jgi:hypothetical protein